MHSAEENFLATFPGMSYYKSSPAINIVVTMVAKVAFSFPENFHHLSSQTHILSLIRFSLKKVLSSFINGKIFMNRREEKGERKSARAGKSFLPNFGSFNALHKHD